MYLNRRMTALFYLLVLALASLHGQSDLWFRNYYIEDGLPHSRARAIIQDSVGWIWIGTTGGLARFDGISFHNYQLGFPDNGSLTTVSCRWEDSYSRLWIGTESDGLLLFNRSQDRFEHFIHNDTSSNCIGSNYVTSIVSDSSGILWVGTNRGLNRFDPSTGFLTRYLTSYSGTW